MSKTPKAAAANETPEGSEDAENPSLEIAKRWCAKQGADWHVVKEAGRGGTAPVYQIISPDGPRALKIYDEEFSTGVRSNLQKERVDLQVKLGDHDCPWLVKIYGGGEFEGRLFVLMSCAPGQELEKILHQVPRDRIRSIVSRIAEAALFLREKGFCHRDIKSANVFVSDDYEVVTLLDVSVLREIQDPVGLGTDHGDQLPVVATARYSPPEYLFRLIEPGPVLWNALDVYQLGALLHDLIMRQPMFQREYEQARENRYRFAWAVATVVPRVHAVDVDTDLVFLANRALAKDWESRSDLSPEDFLGDRATRRENALAMLGLGVRPTTPASSASANYPRLIEFAKRVEAGILESLKEKGVTAQHTQEPTGESGVRVVIEWRQPNSQAGEAVGKARFEVDIESIPDVNPARFSATATLTGMAGDTDRNESIVLPVQEDAEGAAEALSAEAMVGLGELALRLAEVNGGEGN